MADPSPKQMHLYRLSALDQSASRNYITIALCYPCDAEHTETVATRFVASTKAMISNLPILAGVLRSGGGGDGAQRGFLEVAVSLNMINSFAATVKRFGDDVDSPALTYDDLRSARFPSSKLEMEQLAQLAQKPEWDGGATFGAQINIISGGVIAVLQMHHAVADLAGMQEILRLMSEGGKPRFLDHDQLNEEAVVSSRHRARLSDAGGLMAMPTPPPAGPPGLVFGGDAVEETTTCVLAFKMPLLFESLQLVNNRIFDASDEAGRTSVSPSDVLAALLWRAVIRARLAASQMTIPIVHASQEFPAPSTLIIPMNVRAKLQDRLVPNYFGNVVADAKLAEEVAPLSMPIGVGELQTTASRIRAAVRNMSEHNIRLAIANINNSDYTPTNTPTNTPTTSSITDVTITSWDDLLPDEAHLSLGLGEPSFVRKLNAKDAEEGCTVHPRPSGDTPKPWEVTITLKKSTMERLLEDEKFMEYVMMADGERYEGGLPEVDEALHQLSLEEERTRMELRTEWRQGGRALMG